MSENFEPKTDLLTILNSFIQLLMLLSVMTIAVLRFINTRSQLKTNDLKMNIS